MIYWPSQRRGVRAVEGASLENWCALTGTVSSNLTPSADLVTGGVSSQPEADPPLAGNLTTSANFLTGGVR